ncbi:u21-Nephitoxin-Nsp1b_1 [Caerostris darwini]|uniref:U21-Nephitoxin-Nsp1b_1 n=1 Tax=Caerostris darwini TaxID=1538125 RepID=A0AAV4ST13_9ARAC|nr:u21-Nephitoxin-Nsp1b_1 [Caerostris darwini]
MKIIFLAGIFSLTATFTNAELSYSCDFERDTCGFTNQEEQVTNWERVELKLGNRKGYVMAVQTNDTEKHISRMITPYFEHHEEEPGCLTFDFYTTGEGVKGFSVQQEHDYGISGIWTFDKKGSGWQKTRVDVDVDEKTRFFFTARMDPSQGQSIIAVDNVVLRISKC